MKATGPESLFTRILFKFSNGRWLKLNSEHFQQRSIERSIPIDELAFLHPQMWKLVGAEVRIDTGKFVASTWKFKIVGNNYWVVVGLHDTVKTVYKTNEKKAGLGFSVITQWQLYDFVDEVNSKLMEAENRKPITDYNNLYGTGDRKKVSG